MKKTILILFAFLCLFCCTGCGRAPAQETQPVQPAQPEATQEAASAEEEAAPAADALEGETTMEKSLRLLINETEVLVSFQILLDVCSWRAKHIDVDRESAGLTA